MRIFIKIVCLLCVVFLTACGGGGGSAGTTNTANGTSGTSGTSATSVPAGTITIDVLSGAGVSSTSISALEIAQAKITLKDSKGVIIKGAIITFAEVGGNLLSIAPVSKTALTDDAGQATVEIKAATTSSIGATQIGASVSVAGQALSAQKVLSISSAPASSVVIDPQALANAINFLDVNPADKSIVLAGSGGNGRSESATLRFRVVDKNNTPVKGTSVTFSAVPAANVTINIINATSDSDGVVVTTVSSKTVATAVIVRAVVDGKTISTQSDQLLITTGIVTQAGFDLSATKYNLNFGITGDSSDITVAIVDANGNRVADGVPVVFTANYGAVGTSSRGGCTTVNGSCKVTYSVQNPRPNDGTRARVTGSTQIGNGAAISGTLDFIVSDLSLANLYSTASGGPVISTFNGPGNACKFTVSAFVGTPGGFPAPAGTTVSVLGITTDFSGSVKTGSPVLDRATQRTQVNFEFDASAITLIPACNPAGPSTATARADITFTAGSIVKTLPGITISYPSN